jgi:DNA-binding NarL/FixJ family response regulator
VVLVDDHRLFRSGVRAELGEHVDVVGEAETVAEAVALIRATQPDVVLLDVHMPDGGGRAVLDAMRRGHPQVRFLALSVSDAAEDVIAVIRAGARGYVTKSIAAAELVDAVRRIARDAADGNVAPEKIDERLIHKHHYTPDKPDPDLLVRTSGEHRISNYLLWQLAYSELHFTEVLWPDFRRQHLFDAIGEYQRRDRRFGAV